MIQKIKSKEFYIYTNEIIHPDVFKKLYDNEKILTKFNSIVTTFTHHPFATFLAKERYLTNIKEGDIIILRAIKDNKKFEFISKIHKWGRFSIPKTLIKILDIKNHEKINFGVIKEENKNKIKEGFIDLANIQENVKIIYRNNDFVTVFRKYKVPITLPRFIEITPELIELCFLIHGDGHYKTFFYFVNKNLGLHIFVIDKFEEILKIPKNMWKAKLLFNNLANSNLAKEKWKEDLNLEEKQFYPSISQSVFKTSDLGNLRIVIDKTIVSVIFRYIFEQLKDLDEKLDFYALNGLLYAEGGVRKDRRGLHKITLSFNLEEKILFIKILKNTGILDMTHMEQNKRFCISGWENLYKFFRLFYLNKIVLFNIHKDRSKKAFEGFLDHSFTRTMNKYLKILDKKSYFTIKELVKETNHRPDSILDTLRKKQYSKFIKIEGKGINRNPFKISLTIKGGEFIKIVENLEEIYNDRFR